MYMQEPCQHHIYARMQAPVPPSFKNSNYLKIRIFCDFLIIFEQKVAKTTHFCCFFTQNAVPR